MSDYGAKVSQAGYDVKTAAKERLVFSSKYDTFKVYVTGNGTLTVAAAVDPFTPRAGTVTVAHNLSYTPAYFVFVDNPVWATAGKLSPYTFRSIGATHNVANFACDSTNIYITFYNPDSTASHDYEYRYYIYYNELA